jgi:hypothetical protein
MEQAQNTSPTPPPEMEAFQDMLDSEIEALIQKLRMLDPANAHMEIRIESCPKNLHNNRLNWCWNKAASISFFWLRRNAASPKLHHDTIIM